MSPPLPSEDTDSWLTRVGFYTLTICAISRTLFNVESLSPTRLTCIELLYTNTYYVGLSNGALLHYVLGLEIYGATSVKIFL